MKTREFASDAEVVTLVAAFETATIPPSQFTHVAHVAVAALSYLDQLPLADALARMREKLFQFIARRINLIVARWGSAARVEAHYSRELIKSKVAREEWIPPDRLPLPF